MNPRFPSHGRKTVQQSISGKLSIMLDIRRIASALQDVVFNSSLSLALSLAVTLCTKSANGQKEEQLPQIQHAGSLWW